MSLAPAIYCDRKQVSADAETGITEVITVSSAPMVSGGTYVWSISPSATIISGVVGDHTISLTAHLSSEELNISWGPSANPIDTYSVILKNYPTLEISSTPQTLYEILSLPEQLYTTFIAVNEFGEATAFNAAIEKLYNNLEYLIRKTEYFDIAPTTLSFRYGSSNYALTSSAGKQWQQISTSYEPSAYWSYADPVSATHITANKTHTLYVTGSNTLNIMSTISGFDPTVYTRAYPLYASDPFVDIKTVQLDDSGIIWVLETNGRITKLLHSNSTWTQLNSWKYSDGSKRQLYTPLQLLASENKLYILSKTSESSSVYEIRIFDHAMVYQDSVDLSKITFDISGFTITRDYFIVMDVGSTIYIFENSGTYDYKTSIGFASLVNIYDANQTLLVLEGAVLSNITNSVNDYFFYAHTKNILYKFSQDGNLVGFGGLTAPRTASSHSSSPTAGEYIITGLCQDTNNNLYAASNYDIVKYFDPVLVKSRSVMDILPKLWSLEELQVKPNENCSYWVYNRVFNRFYENIELLRNTLMGKLSIYNSQVIISGFTVNEFSTLPYTKSEIFVAINELHSEAAINRNIRKLFQCLETLMNIGNIQGTIPTDYTISDVQYLYWDGRLIFDGFATFNGLLP